jgi:hypothetical protein
VDWELVAKCNGIARGPTARMRFHRLRLAQDRQLPAINVNDASAMMALKKKNCKDAESRAETRNNTKGKRAYNEELTDDDEYGDGTSLAELLAQKRKLYDLITASPTEHLDIKLGAEIKRPRLERGLKSEQDLPIHKGKIDAKQVEPAEIKILEPHMKQEKQHICGTLSGNVSGTSPVHNMVVSEDLQSEQWTKTPKAKVGIGF